MYERIIYLEEVRRAEYFRAQDELVRAAFEITCRELFLFETGLLEQVGTEPCEYYVSQHIYLN